MAVDFGEPIDDATFTLDDISVTGGDASGLAQEGVTTQKYTFTVTPSSDGQVTVTIPADSVKDPAGNNNTASGQLPVTFDRTTPGPTLSTDAASPTNAASVTVTVDFGEPIDAATFTLDDISVTGGDASGLAQEGATTQKYTFTVTPSSDGQLTVTIPADSVKDPAGNNNTASGQLPVTFDRTSPAPSLATDTPSLTNATSVTVDFGEAIDASTFAISDVSVTGGNATSLAHSSANQTFTFTLMPDGDGEGDVTAVIPAGSVTDPAGNDNTASNILSVTLKPNVGCLEYVSYPNNPPVVDVGGSITVAEGETGTLRATVTDMDGDDVETIWFHWSLDNAIITIADPESLVTEFTAPYVDSDTVTYATLYACDGIHTGVGNDVVRITITDIPEPPEPPTPPQLPPPVQEPAYNESPSADAGAGFTINEGATGQLQGTATDPDNDPLTMEWYQTPTWPLLTLTNASDPRTTIVAPQVDGDTTITLILSVSDGDYTVTDQVRITITGIPESLESSESTTPPQLPPPVQESAYNEPPSANAGADFTINEGATGQLQGTATDPDNGPLTIEWYQTPTWPPLTLTNASDPRTAIVAPQVDGDTTITLILSVSDGDYTVTDQVRITITDIPEPPEPSESTTPPQLPPPVQEPAYNEPPSADAGTDFTINEGATGQLQGTATD